MSNRFHNKFHRHNHHTASNPSYPDSAQDPIASQSSPFLGTFYLSGGLSANSAIVAPSAIFSFISASSAIFSVTDLLVTELSGFLVQGTDFSKTVPATYNPYSQQAVTLSGIGLSGSSWGSIAGNFNVGGTAFATSVSTPNLTATNLTNTNLYGNIATFSTSVSTPNLTATNLYGNVATFSTSVSSPSISANSLFVGNSSIHFYNGTTITSSSGNIIETSAQIHNRGIGWVARSTTENNDWLAVTYGKGLFVAVAINGTNQVMTSPDGINWTGRSAASSSLWWSVTYGNGLFVAVSYDGAVMTSTDGITWISQSAATASAWFSVTYGNGLFVAVAADGNVMTSPDGITWTSQAAAEANAWYSVTYGNGLFVAVANSGTNRVMTSPDGITWTSQTAAENNQWWSVTYGNGLFVAVADSGTNRVMTSPDGVTWTSRTAAEANAWHSITYGNGLFVAVADSGTSRVMTSPNGVTWTSRTAAEANAWWSVTYGNGLFVALSTASGGGSNRVMTSGKQAEQVINNRYIAAGSQTLAGELTVTNNISSAHISATAFFGDGSNLTNLPGGAQTPWTSNIGGGGYSLSGVSTISAAHISATAFFGDGSGLTNVAGASQTPWASNIDGAGYDLTNVANISTINLSADSLYVGNSSIHFYSGAILNSGDAFHLTVKGGDNSDPGFSGNPGGAINILAGNNTGGAGNFDGADITICGSNGGGVGPGGNVNIFAGNTDTGCAGDLLLQAGIASDYPNTPNGLILLNSNVSSAHISATAFFGDGSGLTNVAGASQTPWATNIDGGGNSLSGVSTISAAHISATAFFGDGSGLTNVAQTPWGGNIDGGNNCLTNVCTIYSCNFVGGYSNTESGIGLAVFGSSNTISNRSFIAGSSNYVSVDDSAAFGACNVVCAGGAFAQGCNNCIEGDSCYSHAEGYLNRNYGAAYGHLEGTGNCIGCTGYGDGIGAHAEGINTIALCDAAHSQGCATIAKGVGSFTFGCNTYTDCWYAVAGGVCACNNHCNSFLWNDYSDSTAKSTDAHCQFKVNSNGICFTGGTFTIGISTAPMILFIYDLPTSDPTVCGQIWNNAGVLTVSQG